MADNGTLQQWVDESGSIVFFGGAGMSTESGIPDFRSVDGLYHQKFKYPPETMLSSSFFWEHTEEFYDFYREKMICLNAKPNAGHRKLSGLEKAGKLRAVVTQNIDGLHQQAGSQNVLELHGSVRRNRCVKCAKQYGIEAVLQSQGVPRCSCGGIIKPQVVLYEEPLEDGIMERAAKAIRRADMLIIGGTSLAVYPAALLIDAYKGDKLVLINLSKTPADGRANLCIHEPIGQVLDALRVEGCP